MPNVSRKRRLAYLGAGMGVDWDHVVAERLGVTEQAVQYVRSKMGIPKSKKPVPPRPDVVDAKKIKALAEKGLSRDQIAKKLKASPWTVKRIVVRDAIRTKNPRDRPSDDTILDALRRARGEYEKANRLLKKRTWYIQATAARDPALRLKIFELRKRLGCRGWTTKESA